MAIVQGQFAFVGEVARTPPLHTSVQGFVETTTFAEPGLVHAGIHHRSDGQEIVIYEARIGGAADAQTYRRALEGHLERQRWYRPVGRWTNQGGVRRVAFMRTFRVISGAKDTVVDKLANLVQLVVGQVPALKLAILHEGLDQPEEIMLYEEWDETKAGFLADEAPKPYRTAYREETAHMIAERGDLEWLSPIRIYESEA
jgi:quinol monooxygenase YgiN